MEDLKNLLQQLVDRPAAATPSARTGTVPASTQQLIPVFDGTRDTVIPWLERLDQERLAQSWTYKQVRAVAMNRVSPTTRDWFNSWDLQAACQAADMDYNPTDEAFGELEWSITKQRIEDMYLGAASRGRFMSALANMKQQPGESFQQYKARVHIAVSRLWLGIESSRGDAEALEARIRMFFLYDGATNRHVIHGLHEFPKDEDALCRAIEVSEMATQGRGQVGSLPAPAAAAAAAASPDANPNDPAAVAAAVVAALNKRGGRGNHRHQGAGNTGASDAAGKLRCWYCSAPNHVQKECRKFKALQASDPQKAREWLDKNLPQRRKPHRVAEAAAAEPDSSPYYYTPETPQQVAYAAYMAGNAQDGQ